jgi:hypothetical protein
MLDGVSQLPLASAEYEANASVSGWPNGKASLSGSPVVGGDCGFESHSGRDFCFVGMFFWTPSRADWSSEMGNGCVCRSGERVGRMLIHTRSRILYEVRGITI